MLRVGIGICFIVHGLGKFIGGTDTLTFVGSAVSRLGIHHGHLLFGVLAAGIEVVGGLFVSVGLLFRWACLALAMVMAVAMLFDMSQTGHFETYSHALESLILFVSLMVIGPGRFSVDRR